MAVDADAAGLELNSTDATDTPGGHTESASDSAQAGEDVPGGGVVRPRRSPTNQTHHHQLHRRGRRRRTHTRFGHQLFAR